MSTRRIDSIELVHGCEVKSLLFDKCQSSTWLMVPITDLFIKGRQRPAVGELLSLAFSCIFIHVDDFVVAAGSRKVCIGHARNLGAIPIAIDLLRSPYGTCLRVDLIEES